MSSTYLVPQTYSVLTAVTLADSMEAAPPMPDTLVPPTLSGINADDRPRVLFNDPLPADGEAWLTGYPIQRIMDRLPQKWAMLDAAGIAAAVRELRADRTLAEKLGRGAVAFAEKHFSWRRSAAALANFYFSLAPS